ncbi:hypothetical protein FRC12_017563 [Ceratobasidium sp. 428]|nr:hypothetical protein FRC12_017563 [Ceratobasidium sp. 428]
MFSNPLDLYKLSIEYALPNSRVNAARRLSGGEHNLLNPAFLSELSPTRLLDRNIVTIAAIQGARYKIITEALLHFDTPHWQLLFRNQHFLAASCEICQKLIRTARHDASFTPLPGWAMTWAVATHKALAAAPLDQCLRFFDAGIFNTFENADFTCLACLSCLVTDRAERARESFNGWAIYPKDLLETRLAALDPLLHLIC